MAIVKKIIENILTALYQPFWYSVILAVLIQFFIMYVEGEKLLTGRYKGAIKTWILKFKKSCIFRKQFFCIFYIALVMFRTLFNRSMWEYPLANVIGVWGIYTTDQSTGAKVIATEGIENVVLFIPLLFLLFWAYPMNKYLKSNSYSSYLRHGFKLAFLISCSIEFTQLFLRIGAFQLSDIAQNTLGGVIGTAFYWLIYRRTLKNGGN